MPILALYSTIVLIWGSTWIVITFQLGQVAPGLSVAYRFTLASLVLFIWLLLRNGGRLISFTAAQHRIIALQGVFLFGGNYLFVYLGSERLSSGLVAVLMSLLPLFTILNQIVFMRLPVRGSVLTASLTGLIGTALIFYPQFSEFSGAQNSGSGDNSVSSIAGILFCVLAAWLASVGNLYAVRNAGAGLPIMETTAWAMAYGAAFMFIISAVSGTEFTFDTSFNYLWSLVYLAVLGSVFAFVFYFMLGAKIGADKSAYVAVAIPVIALGISTLFESYQWSVNAVFGIALILLGNYLILRPAKPLVELA
jgi:drug/metabolite transporter (DMT)-like permease